MAPLRKEIRICMGSSCFSRGNRNTLGMIQHYLREHQLENDVVLKGNHCFDNCSEGPTLRIGGRIYTHVSAENIAEIMEREFGGLKNSNHGTVVKDQ
jgi:NADH:ubiquinone oxidoreductase subunit E